MIDASLYSSSKSKCSTSNLSFWVRANLATRALHKFTSAGITASAPYVRENGVSLVDLLGVVRYAHKMLAAPRPTYLLHHPIFSSTRRGLPCWWLQLDHFSVDTLKWNIFFDAEITIKCANSVTIKLQTIIRY